MRQCKRWPRLDAKSSVRRREVTAVVRSVCVGAPLGLGEGVSEPLGHFAGHFATGPGAKDNEG